MPYNKYQVWKETRGNGYPYLSVVIPAYNEEDRIIPTIGAIASHISSLGITWELLVADDGSTDRTVEIVESLDLANLLVLKAPQNEGKGSAVRRGVLAARGRYILFADADNSTPIEEFENLLTQLRDKGFDISIGSRAAGKGKSMKRSFLRRVLSAGLRWVVKYILNINIQDTQCGFKLYERHAAIKLYGNLTMKGFSFDLENLFLATKYGYKIAEVPVEWIDAPGSKVDPHKEVQRFLTALAKIKIKDLKGEYAIQA